MLLQSVLMLSSDPCYCFCHNIFTLFQVYVCTTFGNRSRKTCYVGRIYGYFHKELPWQQKNVLFCDAILTAHRQSMLYLTQKIIAPRLV